MVTRITKGTKVRMVDCQEAEQYKDRVWICRTDSFFPKLIKEKEFVYLEEYAGWFGCEFLEEVK